MQRKRYDLPPLDFIQGFEASARHLSFTKAAEELYLTQSAVSRQILQAAAENLRADPVARQLSITTTTGFAALWLIPRLKRFTIGHPDIDVRISATDISVNLDRGLIDIAIRYGSKENMPAGAIPLFGEEILPVCSPSLITDGALPLATPADLKHHALLHLDYPGMQRSWFDWGTWLTAEGIGDLKSAGALHFSQYDQMIHAAIAGQGVALGRIPLLQEMIRNGALVAPFARAVAGTRGYFVLTTAQAASKQFAREFGVWLQSEARADTITH